MDREAWWATARGITKSPTGLKRLSTHSCSQYAKGTHEIHDSSSLGLIKRMLVICLYKKMKKNKKCFVHAIKYLLNLELQTSLINLIL